MQALFLLIILSFLQISCASQSKSVNVTVETTITDGTAKMIPEDSFAYALWNIKNNTTLFQKYIKADTDVIPETGFKKIGDVSVTGESVIGGKKFRVTYDLAKAVLNSNSTFKIPFFLENLTDGIGYNDELIWNPVEDTAGLLLSFDDNHFNSWRQHLETFNSYGAKVTFFIQGRLVQGRLEKGNNTATLENFCKEARSLGHDLGFHTVNHKNLTKVSRKVFKSETIEGAESFSRAGISFSAIAYPFGFSAPWMHEALAPVFKITRGYGVNTRFYDSQAITNRHIVSKAIDNIIYPDNQKFEDDIRLILLVTKFSGSSIIPFTSHDLSDTAKWGIKPSRLEFLLKTAQELKLKFYTYRELYAIGY